MMMKEREKKKKQIESEKKTLNVIAFKIVHLFDGVMCTFIFGACLLIDFTALIHENACIWKPVILSMLINALY